MNKLQEIFEECFQKDQVDNLNAEDYLLAEGIKNFKEFFDAQAKKIYDYVISQTPEDCHQWIQDEDWISECIADDYYGKLALYKGYLFLLVDEDTYLVNSGIGVEIW